MKSIYVILILFCIFIIISGASLFISFKAHVSDAGYYPSSIMYRPSSENPSMRAELQAQFIAAQTKFDQGNYEEAIKTFQAGVEENPNFTELSSDFANTLYNHFKDLVSLVPYNLNYIVATARLAEQLELRKEAVYYWREVAKNFFPESATHQLAIQHLKAFSLQEKSDMLTSCIAICAM